MTFQQITIIGNVGKEPNLRYLQDGTPVVDFTVATSKVSGRGDTRKEVTTWFKVTIWREQAETAASLIKKGTKVMLLGEVSASAYIDKTTNEPRASLELTASKFVLLTPKNENNGSAHTDTDSGYAPQRNTRTAPPVNENDIPF